MENFALMHGHLVYFMALWYITYVVLYVFHRNSMFYQEQSGDPVFLKNNDNLAIIWN
jgi:hypothetical protein